MNTELTHEEEIYLNHFLSHRGRESRVFAATSTVLLVFGGILVLLSAAAILQHMTDSTVVLAGLPGFLGGIVCFGLYIILSRKAGELRLMGSILTKLAGRKGGE
jgi:hypothetical protein